MTGYDTGAQYPTGGPQYVPGYEGDPRHQAGGWAGVQYPGHTQVEVRQVSSSESMIFIGGRHRLVHMRWEV